jgi:hypothetical protein
MVRNRMSANNSILANLGETACAESFQRRSSGSQIGFIFFGSAAANGVTFSTGCKGRSVASSKMVMSNITFSSVRLVSFVPAKKTGLERRLKIDGG